MTTTFTALVLAGRRKRSGDGLNGDTLKALMPLNGVPMIARVVAALKASPHVGNIIVCGPPEISDYPGVTFFPMAGSPARSFVSFMESRSDPGPLLVTTADHALLTTERRAAKGSR